MGFGGSCKFFKFLWVERGPGVSLGLGLWKGIAGLQGFGQL